MSTMLRTAPAHAPGLKALITRHPVVAYFVLAFVGTWFLLLWAALSRGTYGLGMLPFAAPDELAFVLVMLSAYTGPLMASLVVTGATEGRAGLRRLRRRLFLWRVGPLWYMVALFVPLAIWLLAYGAVLNGLPLRNLASDWSLLVSAFLPNVLLGLLLPSLGEETGWRGFALPHLQRRYGPVVATIMLGTLHSVWHLPAFFTVGLGPFSPGSFTTFVLTGIAGTFLYTWLVNSARGSVLLAVVFHASSNAASSLVSQLIPADASAAEWARPLVESNMINVLAFGLVAALLVLATRGRLGYRADPTVSPADTAPKAGVEDR